jgi:hypothetical protein
MLSGDNVKHPRSLRKAWNDIVKQSWWPYAVHKAKTFLHCLKVKINNATSILGSIYTIIMELLIGLFEVCIQKPIEKRILQFIKKSNQISVCWLCLHESSAPFPPFTAPSLSISDVYSIMMLSYKLQWSDCWLRYGKASSKFFMDRGSVWLYRSFIRLFHFSHSSSVGKRIIWCTLWVRTEYKCEEGVIIAYEHQISNELFDPMRLVL